MRRCRYFETGRYLATVRRDCDVIEGISGVVPAHPSVLTRRQIDRVVRAVEDEEMRVPSFGQPPVPITEDRDIGHESRMRTLPSLLAKSECAFDRRVLVEEIGDDEELARVGKPPHPEDAEREVGRRFCLTPSQRHHVHLLAAVDLSEEGESGCIRADCGFGCGLRRRRERDGVRAVQEHPPDPRRALPRLHRIGGDGRDDYVA